MRFLSTPSARRATHKAAQPHTPPGYFYPRPPRGGRQKQPCTGATTAAISIHALREEGDRFPCSFHLPAGDFYPRPPRGGRLGFDRQPPQRGIFLSTPSARRATYTVDKLRDTQRISIHALREEGDSTQEPLNKVLCKISIHALREEGDRGAGLLRGRFRGFLSTPSARRATCTASDRGRPRKFLSTPSARRATASSSASSVRLSFLSTPSARRATHRTFF